MTKLSSTADQEYPSCETCDKPHTPAPQANVEPTQHKIRFVGNLTHAKGYIRIKGDHQQCKTCDSPNITSHYHRKFINSPAEDPKHKCGLGERLQGDLKGLKGFEKGSKV